MGLYDLACAAGPTLGPIVAGFAVVANGWRWAFWEMLWITGFALALLSFSMPEVSLLLLFLFFGLLLVPALLSSFFSQAATVHFWSTGEAFTHQTGSCKEGLEVFTVS